MNFIFVSNFKRIHTNFKSMNIMRNVERKSNTFEKKPERKKVKIYFEKTISSYFW